MDVDGHYYNNDCTSGHIRYFYLRDGYPDVGGNGSGLMGNSIHNNSNYDDVIFYISGGQPDLGVSSGGDDGNNSLDRDQAAGHYYVYNTSGNTVKAEKNYWGTSSPSSSKFYASGKVDYIPYLSSNPHLSKMLASDENELAPGKNLKKQNKYDEAFDEFKKVLDETDDDVNAAYALGNMFSCAKLNKSLLSFEKDLEGYTKDSRKEVNVRAKICLGKLYAYTERLEKAEDMLKSFKPGTNADREALLHLLDYYVIYGEKEKADNLANTIRERFKDNEYLESDIASAFEIVNYGSKRDLIYSGDLGKTEPTLESESEKVNGVSVYPNPFNAEAKIVFKVDEAGRIRLAVFNTLGQKVRTLAVRRMGQGRHEILWNGLDDFGNQVSTGLYFVSLIANNKRQIAKMVFAK